MIATMLRRALRSFVENLQLNLVATGVIATAILLAGVALLVTVNLDRMVGSWDRDVHVSAYFFADVGMERRFAIKDEIAARAEVERVTYVSEAEARAWLEERLPDVGPVLDELGDEVMPASLEITLVPGAFGPDEISGFVASISGPDFEDLEYGAEWVQRFNSLLALVRGLGLALGGLLCVAAVFLVGNTMHLVAYARRPELETMKLVGATFGFVALPFLLEGAAQGLLGALLALGLLRGVHGLLLDQLQGALELALAGDTLGFLAWTHQGALIFTGVLLGMSGCWLAVRRFWRLAP